jgi:hypothetical protein
MLVERRWLTGRWPPSRPAALKLAPLTAPCIPIQIPAVSGAPCLPLTLGGRPTVRGRGLPAVVTHGRGIIIDQTFILYRIIAEA